MHQKIEGFEKYTNETHSQLQIAQRAASLCPVCDNPDWQRLEEESEHWLIPEPGRIHRCRYCGLYMVLPQPTIVDNLAHFQDQDFYTKTVGLKQAVFRRRVDLMQRIAPGRRLLDVGCARGDLLVLARAAGFEVAGIDVSKYACRYAKEYLGLDAQNISISEVPSSSYDIVHANHVLEHVNDPVNFAKELRRILAPGGICIIEVPNEFMNLRVRISRRLQRLPRRIVPSIHLFFYDPITLEKLMARAGFKTKKIFTSSNRIGRAILPGLLKNTFYNSVRAVADLTGNGDNIIYIGT